eukprot:GHVR01170588.1.p1 GENE.GHVR01170588.1~~GHVR01170588.1.p1  ORF type:complete len:134 (-),score=12.76 GHVR01170588.1:794-1195(-)
MHPNVTTRSMNGGRTPDDGFHLNNLANRITSPDTLASGLTQTNETHTHTHTHTHTQGHVTGTSRTEAEINETEILRKINEENILRQARQEQERLTAEELDNQRQDDFINQITNRVTTKLTNQLTDHPIIFYIK